MCLLAALSAAGDLGAGALTAQEAVVVRGTLMDSVGRAPVASGGIQVLGEAGQVLGTALSDAEGRFVLPFPAQGVIRLRAQRVGYQGRVVGPFQVAAGDTVDITIWLEAIPIVVDTILARVRRGVRALRPGEQLVYGRLLDDESGDPVTQGTIELLAPGGSVIGSGISDADGVFHIVSPRPGTYRLRAGRIGYQTAESSELNLMLGDSIGVEFFLSTQAVLLAPLTVTASARPWWNRAEMRGVRDFAERYAQFSRSGFGQFMTRDSIAAWEGRVLDVGQMLMANMSNVWMATLDGGITLRRNCTPRYFLNGMEVPEESVRGFPPNLLEGVEVYVSPTIPQQFNRGFPCGVIVYWLRVSPYENPPRRKVWTYLGMGALLSVLLFVVR